MYGDEPFVVGFSLCVVWVVELFNIRTSKIDEILGYKKCFATLLEYRVGVEYQH